MDAPLDLFRARREELIALVRRQGEQIADLEREVARLHAELVSNVSTASTGYAGRHQYCWAHLLRDGDEQVAQHRQDATVVG